ncbi:Foldase protein PrsA [Diplonema papillatum]|nr:Foldase protein PrsA [Diplonema papillatum]
MDLSYDTLVVIGCVVLSVVALTIMYFVTGQGPKVAASHILVKTKEEAESIYAGLSGRSGKDLESAFKQAAYQSSLCPSGQQSGGNLGTFGLGVMDPIFEKACLEQKIGDVGPPVPTGFGCHLILVHDRQGMDPKQD